MRLVEQSAKIILHMPVEPNDFEGYILSDQSFVSEWFPNTWFEHVARVCYRSEDKACPGSAEKMVKMLRARGHESIFEHLIVTAELTIDRGVLGEITRHRVCSFACESSRYCNYTNGKFDGGVSFIMPLDQSVEMQEEWKQHMSACEEFYKKIIMLGAKPEEARDGLPLCLATNLIMTTNAREWKHILELRTSSQAHPKMRQVMGIVQEQLEDLMPEIFCEPEPKEDKWAKLKEKICSAGLPDDIRQDMLEILEKNA